MNWNVFGIWALVQLRQRCSLLPVGESQPLPARHPRHHRRLSPPPGPLPSAREPLDPWPGEFPREKAAWRERPAAEAEPAAGERCDRSAAKGVG